MPLGRRRPLMRGAVVGGAAYATGKRVQRGQQEEAEQDQAIGDLQEQQQEEQAPAAVEPPPPAPAPSESATDRFAALTQLKELLDGGVLTQEEFDSEKQKILQAS
jgi:Short C-terminal domain